VTLDRNLWMPLRKANRASKSFNSASENRKLFRSYRQLRPLRSLSLSARDRRREL